MKPKLNPRDPPEEDDGPWEIPAHMGSINQLTEKSAIGQPFRPNPHALGRVGYEIDPKIIARHKRFGDGTGTRRFRRAGKKRTRA
jgi:hypothetical protein